MIKFFRKIRQKLLSENRFSKYLIYALGEILLVVIGILIALSINNWNEDRKNNLREIRLVKNVVEDLRLDLAHFQQSLNELDDQLEVVDRIIAKALDADYELNYDSIGLVRYSSDFRPITQRNHAGPVSNMINEVVREELQEYFLMEEQVLDIFKEYEGIIHGKVRPYLSDVGMHNLEAIYTRRQSPLGPALLLTDVLDEQISTIRFQQILFERRLKTESLQFLLNQLMKNNQALAKRLESVDSN